MWWVGYGRVGGSRYDEIGRKRLFFFDWQGVVGVLVLGWVWAVQAGRGFVVCRKCGGEEGEWEGGCYVVGHWLRSEMDVFGFQEC